MVMENVEIEVKRNDKTTTLTGVSKRLVLKPIFFWIFFFFLYVNVGYYNRFSAFIYNKYRDYIWHNKFM